MIALKSVLKMESTMFVLFVFLIEIVDLLVLTDNFPQYLQLILF